MVGEGEGWLATGRVRTGRPTAAAARAFGGSLARTHAAGAAAFGCAPPGWSGPGRIGRAVLPLVEVDEGGRTAAAPASEARETRAPRSWGAFYAADRLLPYLPAARDAGALDAAGARRVERLAARVADGELDSPQPALVTGGVARLHGDLWSGNVLWDAAAGNRGVLIDPAAHGGHAETDLAMLALFGQPSLEDVLAGYEEVSPLGDGWRERVPLHQLHPLLVHAVLFGGGYGPAAVRAAGQY